MRDKNIVIAVLAGSMLALAACGGINSIKTGGTEGRFDARSGSMRRY